MLQLSQNVEKHREARLLCDEPSSTGHPVGAFGHPWGLDYTSTQGVISGRTPKFGGDLLQTDAPINAGNSAVNGVRIRNLEHLYRTLSELPNSVPAELDFLRTGTTEEEGRILGLIRREIIAAPPQRFGAW